MFQSGPLDVKPYYDDGQITLYCGDCRDILPQLGPQSIDLVLTDPPYGVGFRYDGPYQDKQRGYQDWLLPVVAELRRVGRVVLLTPGIGNLWLYPQPTWVACWAKPGSMRRSGLGAFNEWEPILVYGKRKFNDFKWLPAQGQDDTGGHPCPKPLLLYRWLIAKAADVDAVVLDPFAGSGTALRAAKDLNRRAIGVEINPAYCEIAVRRLAQQVLPLGV
jgi:site-specific DNA-methyltransferase (adenine-specific)